MNILYLLVIIGFGLGSFTTGIAWFASRFRHIGKTWLITLPEIPGTLATMERKRLKAGYFDRKSNEPNAKRDDKDRITPAGPASYPSNMGPIHILSSGGFSLVAPSKLEAAKTIEYVAVAEWITNNKRLPNASEAKDGDFAQNLGKARDDAAKRATRFLIWDPLASWKACRESVMQKLYQSAGGMEDPWYAKPLVVIGIVAVVGVLAVLGVLVVKVLPMLQQSGG